MKPEPAFAQNGKSSDGSPRLRSVCKICTSRVNLVRYEARRQEVNAPTSIEKACTKCHVTKPSCQFSKCLMTQDRLQSWCNACASSNSLARYHDIRASMTSDELDQSRTRDAADKKSRYAADREFRETCKQHTRAYYHQNRDKCVAASVERERELCLDPVFRLNKSIRTQISQGLNHGLKKDQLNIKQGAWFEGVDFKGLDASQYCCQVITTEQAAVFTRQHHYTGSAPAIATICFGLYRKDNDQALLGVGMWMPAQLSTAGLVHPEAPQRVLSLSRFSLIPDAPKNAASYFLGQQTRMIRKTDKFSLLISYADKAENHEGTIYRAAGWKLHGMSAPTTRWTQDGAVVSQRSGTESLTREQMLAKGAVDAGKSQKLRFILKLV